MSSGGGKILCLPVMCDEKILNLSVVERYYVFRESEVERY